MLDDRTDALFPLPNSPAGKLLGHLVSRQIPGTSIDTSTAQVARGAGLRAAESAAALAKLSDDGLVLVEPGRGDQVTVTVLVAPPLEEYGIRPNWGDAGQPVTAIPLAVSSGTPASASRTSAPAAAVLDTPLMAPGGARTGRAAVAGAGGQRSVRKGATVTTTSQANSTPPGADVQEDGTPASNNSGPRRGRISPAAQTLPLPDTGASAQPPQPGPAPSEVPEGGEGGRGRRRAAPEAQPSVDETALVRGFVERFERLLAEIEDWKKRAQAAEGRASQTEKQLRDAERRASSAEARLAEANERLRTWADLTRRMQQLSRQADGGSRPRPAGRGRSADGSAPGA